MIAPHRLTVVCDTCHAALQTPRPTVGAARAWADKRGWHPAAHGDGAHRAARKWSTAQDDTDLCPPCWHARHQRHTPVMPGCPQCEQSGADGLWAPTGPL